MPQLPLLPRATVLGRALRHRNYRLFFGGQLVSLVGTWMQTTAQAWLVYRLSGSAELLGLAAFASQGPVFLLAQIGGAVADRHDRRRILVWTQLLSMCLAFVLAYLTLSGLIRVWEVFVLSALLGVVNAFDIPTRQAFVVEMVGREDLQNAIALNSSMFNAARLVGPSAAGVLVAVAGEGWCFLLNAVSFLAVIAGLLAMRRPPFAAADFKESLLARVRQGLGFAMHTRPITVVLVLIGLMSLLGMPYMVLMPIFANQILGGGAGHLGILMSSAGFGALLGALVLASRTSLSGTGRLIGTAVIVFGATLILFASSRSFLVSAGLLVVIGFCQMIHTASSNTLIQAMVPDAYRGRVMALYSTMFMGMAPFGGLLCGLSASVVGAPATVAAGGACCIVAGGVFLRVLPGLREQARKLVAAAKTENPAGLS